MCNINIKKTLNYRMFSTRPVAAEKYEMRGRSTIILHHHYRVDMQLGKGVLVIFGLHAYLKPLLIDLIKIGYQLFLNHLKKSISMLKTFTLTKYLNIKMIG